MTVAIIFQKRGFKEAKHSYTVYLDKKSVINER